MNLMPHRRRNEEAIAVTGDRRITTDFTTLFTIFGGVIALSLGYYDLKSDLSMTKKTVEMLATSSSADHDALIKTAAFVEELEKSRDKADKAREWARKD